MKKAKIINLFGLSGSGKTTIEQMLKKTEGFNKVTSVCTRPMRDGEVEGEDYYFVSESEFGKLEHRKQFAEVGGKYGGRYGVLWSEIKEDKINVLVTAKDGIDELEALDMYDMINVWFDCNVCERFVRIGKRNNLEYALGRIEKDGFRRGEEIDNADFIIDTSKMSQYEMFNSVWCIMHGMGWVTIEGLL